VTAFLDPVFAGRLFEALDTGRAAQVLEGLETDKAAAIMDALESKRAAEIGGAMDLGKAALAWSFMQPVQAGRVLDEVPAEWTTEVVKAVPEPRLIPRLPEASAAKLWEVPVQVLMDNLPSVPVDFWNRPEVDPSLPEPQGTDVSETMSVYTLPEARESQWALLVGSPLPIERLWAKFRRPKADLQVIFQQLKRKPIGLPDLPPEQTVNTFFDISLENSAPDDLFLAAAIVSVEKSWLNLNSVHKWSVQFNRFDENLSEWVPFPTKRVREDEQRVSFAVVVPGFSTIALTGSRTLPAQSFSVTDLSIPPASPREGEDVTVNVLVRNNGSSRATYPVNLWLNHSIMASQTAQVDAGKSSPLSFSVRTAEGVYELRVERIIGELKVGPATAIPAPQVTPPSVGGTSLAFTALLALGIVGLSLLLGGAFLTSRSKA
jgi:PGF-pre-PGF domain-containing protein